MFNIILDADPYLEYYFDNGSELKSDTALLNVIIMNNELEEYFTKVK